MMLSDLLDSDLPPNLAGYALVFDDAINIAILMAQSSMAQHRLQPVPTSDGRWFVCADCLTEYHGIFAQLFSKLDIKMADYVAVVSMADLRMQFDGSES